MSPGQEGPLRFAGIYLTVLLRLLACRRLQSLRVSYGCLMPNDLFVPKPAPLSWGVPMPPVAALRPGPGNWMRSLTLAALTLVAPGAALADYKLEFEGTSFREYYCGVTLTMTNESEAHLTEINGFVASMIDGEQVARSRGMSFLNLAPGDSATKLFEAPNAPCDEATEYVFIVGACRFDASFAPQADCAARIDGVAPVAEEAGY